MQEKIKKIYDKMNNPALPLVTAAHCIDVGSTWLATKVYGIGGEQQPIARKLMEKMGIEKGMLTYDLGFYTPLVYGVTINLLYGLETVFVEKLKIRNKHVEKALTNHYFSNTALASSISLRFYYGGLYNIQKFIDNLNMPEPWNKVVPIATVASIGVPYGIFLVKHLSEKIISSKDDQEFVNPDSTVVLGRAVNDDGTASEESKRRVEGMMKLYSLYGMNAIFSGGNVKRKTKVSEAESMKRYALEKGVSEKDLYLEEKSKDLIGNIFYSKEYLKKLNVKNTAIITSKPVRNSTNFIAQNLMKEYNPRTYFVEGEKSEDSYKEKLKEGIRIFKDAMIIAPIKIFGEEKGRKFFDIYNSKLLSRLVG